MLYRTDEILKKYKTNIELEKAIKNKKIFSPPLFFRSQPAKNRCRNKAH